MTFSTWANDGQMRQGSFQGLMDTLQLVKLPAGGVQIPGPSRNPHARRACEFIKAHARE